MGRGNQNEAKRKKLKILKVIILNMDGMQVHLLKTGHHNLGDAGKSVARKRHKKVRKTEGPEALGRQR